MAGPRRLLLAVCLSHQVLADLLGLRLHRRDVPYQGLQREVDLFGQYPRRDPARLRSAVMEPKASRPHMPGYGILGPEEGTGLLPWSWARERLAASHDYWLATVDKGGAPHVMPVWGVWHDDALWFSAAPGSRKVRNLQRDPRATCTTDDAEEPVVVEGVVVRARDRADNERFTALVNAKYGTSYSVEFYLANATMRLRPVRAFGLTQADFAGSPTRWHFDAR